MEKVSMFENISNTRVADARLQAYFLSNNMLNVFAIMLGVIDGTINVELNDTMNGSILSFLYKQRDYVINDFKTFIDSSEYPLFYSVINGNIIDSFYLLYPEIKDNSDNSPYIDFITNYLTGYKVNDFSSLISILSTYNNGFKDSGQIKKVLN